MSLAPAVELGAGADARFARAAQRPVRRPHQLEDSSMHRSLLRASFAAAALLACSTEPADQMPTLTASAPEVLAGRARVPGGELYYETAGSGQPVVFVHGNAGDLRHWDLQFEDLAADHMVVRYDVVGFGRSTNQWLESPSHITVNLPPYSTTLVSSGPT